MAQFGSFSAAKLVSPKLPMDALALMHSFGTRPEGFAHLGWNSQLYAVKTAFSRATSFHSIWQLVIFTSTKL